MDADENGTPYTPYSPSASPLRDGREGASPDRGTVAGEAFDANNFAVVIRGA